VDTHSPIFLGLVAAQDPAFSVHNADARAFQRHIDPGKVLHGRLSMMLAQAQILTPLLMTPSL
jgi:hypothetical protein